VPYRICLKCHGERTGTFVPKLYFCW
jgi:hypothetical protein